MADDDLSYLAGLSAHPNRPGDTSNLNSSFASSLAGALREANAQGLNLGLESGYRDPQLLTQQGVTGPAARFDAAGNSLHSYGLAADISGLGGANSRTAQAWAAIAARHGLYNPYGIGSPAEFNHWQALPFTLDQRPDVRTALQNASAAPAPINPGLTVNTSPLAGSHAQFITDYARQAGVDPNLALGIANAEGLRAWSARNPNAASTIDVSGGQPFSFGDFQLNVHPGALGAKALAAGIDPRDPAQWQAADRFAIDQMKAGGVGPWRGDPVAKAYLARGVTPDISGILAQAQNTPVGSTSAGMRPPQQGGVNAAYGADARNAPTAIAGALGAPGAGSVLPGFGTAQASEGFLKGVGDLDKAMGGKGLPGQDQSPGGGQDQIRPSPMIPGPGAMNVSPLIGQSLPMMARLTGYAPSTTYGQTLTSMQDPSQWGAQAPPGASPYANAGPQAPPGTSLTSLQQLQMLMQQQAAMAGGGSPYGGYYG